MHALGRVVSTPAWNPRVRHSPVWHCTRADEGGFSPPRAVCTAQHGPAGMYPCACACACARQQPSAVTRWGLMAPPSTRRLGDVDRRSMWCAPPTAPSTVINMYFSLRATFVTIFGHKRRPLLLLRLRFNCSFTVVQIVNTGGFDSFCRPVIRTPILCTMPMIMHALGCVVPTPACAEPACAPQPRVAMHTCR